MELTVGVGLMVIVKVVVGPVQVTPLLVKLAVTLKVEVNGEVPEFVDVNAGTGPVPLNDASPMASALLDQL